jgi:hypothetical protein
MNPPSARDRTAPQRDERAVAVVLLEARVGQDEGDQVGAHREHDQSGEQRAQHAERAPRRDVRDEHPEDHGADDRAEDHRAPLRRRLRHAVEVPVQAVLVGVDDEHRRPAEDREALADDDDPRWRATATRAGPRAGRRSSAAFAVSGSRTRTAAAVGAGPAPAGRRPIAHRQMRARLPAHLVAARGLGADGHGLVGVGGRQRPSRRLVRRARRELDRAAQRGGPRR